MKRRLIAAPIVILVVTLAAAAVLANGEGTPSPLGITPGPIPSTLTVSVWTDKTTYALGETVRVYFSVSQQAYVYLYDQQPDGVVRLVFPNAYSQANFVGAGTHSLPDAAYQFTVTPPTGTERLQIFASLAPLALVPNAYGEPFPEVATNPDAARGAIQPHILGIVPTPTWTTAWTSFLITGSYSGGCCYPAYPPIPPFFAWFPGGAWFWQDGHWCWGSPTSGWFWYYGPDGHWRFEIHFHVGN